MIDLPLLQVAIKTRTQAGVIQVFDTIRKRWLNLSPEEHVRQLLLNYLTEKQGYPASLIAVERGLSLGHTTLRFDVVIYHRATQSPWLLAECKAPDVLIDEGTLEQLLRYHGKLPECRYWLLTNGHQTYCADVDAGTQKVRWLSKLPTY